MGPVLIKTAPNVPKKQQLVKQLAKASQGPMPRLLVKKNAVGLVLIKTAPNVPKKQLLVRQNAKPKILK